MPSRFVRPARAGVFLLAGLSLLALACGGAARYGEGRGERCPLLPGPASGAAALRLVLPAGAADTLRVAGAPLAPGIAEGVLFAQLYEGLTELDCAGRVAPALAQAWETGDGGRTWRFTIAGEARFWDGSPVEAADVVAAWLRTESLAAAAGLVPPVADLWPLAERVRVADARVLELRLDRAVPDLPRRLAIPALAISAGRPLLHWRLGTGPLRPRALHLPPGSAAVLEPNARHRRPAACASLALSLPAGEPDFALLDAADAALLPDPERLAYFERRPGLELRPLPWDRLYLLVRVLPVAEPGVAADEPWLRSLRGDLERGDLLRGVARAAVAADLVDFLPDYAPAAGRFADPALATAEPPPRILHRADDPFAAALAERVAALVGQGTVAAAIAMPGPPLAALAAQSGPAALVVAVTRDGPWDRRLAAATIHPLALARTAIVAREGLAGLELDGLGRLRLDRAGWIEMP